jgi:hypothetical protein
MQYNPKKEVGSSTLEILLAFAILSICMAAIILVIFGNQSVAIDTQTNNEALYKAQASMERARALSRQNFLGVISTTTTSTSTITYTNIFTVSDVTQCKKQATSTVTWTTGSRTQKVELSTFFVDIAGALALGNDCATDPPSGDWSHPQEKGFLNITPGGSATGIDVTTNKAYITLSNTPSTRPDIAIIDVTSSTSPALIKAVNVKNAPGFNALDVATSTNGRLYAYIATNDPNGQFLIMDVTDANTPTFVASTTLPGISTGVGKSIFYYNKKVYIGTSYFVCPGCAELNIYDVSTPTNPSHVASIDVGRNVNAVYVRNGLAYLATGSGSAGVHNPFKIYDVDPTHVFPNPIQTYLQQVGSFNTTGDEDGTAIFLLGNKAYLGLQHTPASRSDFWILDIAQVSSVISTASTTLGLNSSSQVNGIRVAGNLAFLGISDPNTGFQVLDISKKPIGNVGAFNFQQDTTGVDMDNNTVYLSSNSGSRTLEIVGPTP